MIEIGRGMAAAGPVLAAGPGAALARPIGISAAASSEATMARVSRYASPGAEMAALGVRARNGGFFLMTLVVVIVSLMAGKPAI